MDYIAGDGNGDFKGQPKSWNPDTALSAIEQLQILLPAAELSGIDVELVQQLEVEVTERNRLFENRLGLVAIAAAGDKGGQIVASVIRGIAKVAPDDNGGAVQQGAVAFVNLIEVV